jgi:hypothetical protein
MQFTITREQPATGGRSRTNREEMAPLFDGEGADGKGLEVEPEELVDVSPSEAWPWVSDENVSTWGIQVASVKLVTVPFAALDSQAAKEAGSGAGGVAIWPFSNRHLPFSDQRDSEGELIIDAGPDTFDARWAHFLRMYPQYFENGIPTHGGTEVMTAVAAADEHFMEEFGDRSRAERPKRARILHTDGLLKDAKAFRRYLADATPVLDDKVSARTPLGNHKDWDEAWLACIYGEEGGEARKAYEQYLELAADHPWIHPVYFSDVTNSEEIAEDIAYLAVPVHPAA